VTSLEPAQQLASSAMEAPFIEITVTSLEPAAQLPASSAPLAHLSITREPGAVCPEPLDATPFSFQWTARHDSGELPPVPSTGHYALAVSSLQEAKSRMDAEFQRLLGKAPKAEEGAGSSSSSSAGDAAASSGGAAAEEVLVGGGSEGSESQRKKPRVAEAEE
jgi:hypothetical protein